MAKDGLNPPSFEASGITDTSEKGGQNKHQNKMKANTEESHKSVLDKAFGSKSRVLVDLMNLSSDDSAQRSKAEFNSANVLGLSSRESNNNEGMDHEKIREDKTSEPRTYCCNFCKREFSSSQALGGHQNAHRQERNMVKSVPGMKIGVLGHPHFPCYNPGGGLSHHIYGSNYSRTLRARMDSMIQKPHPCGWIPPRYGYGGCKWPRQVVMNPSLTLDRLMIERFQAYNGGFGILESSENPTVEDSTIPFIRFGNSSSYVAEISGNALIKPTSTSTSDHQVRPAEESAKVDDDHEPPGIDLTLKL